MEYKSNILENKTPNLIQLGDALIVDKSTNYISIGLAQSGDINSKLLVKSADSTANQIVLQHSGNGVSIVGIGQESSHGSLLLRLNSGLTQVRLSAYNNNYIIPSVGIGNTSPQDKIDVTGVVNSSRSIVSQSVYTTFSARSNRTTNDYGGINKQYLKLNLVTPGASTTGESSGHGIADLRFQLANNANNTDMADIMTLRYNGNVGIGVTVPGQKLEVAGNIKLISTADYIMFGSGGTSPSWAAPMIFRSGTSMAISDYSGVQLGGYDGSSYGSRFYVKGAGQVQMFSYGGTSSLGTPTYLLGTDASGNIVKTNTVPGSAAGPYLPLAGGTMTGTLTVNAPFVNSGFSQVMTPMLSASGTQAREFEVARAFMDYNDWSDTGVINFDLMEASWDEGCTKSYAIRWGYLNQYDIDLVNITGGGDASKNFEAFLGTLTLVSGDIYYLPIMVRVKYYTSCEGLFKTNRNLTTNALSTAKASLYITPTAVPTNIASFTVVDNVEFSGAADNINIGSGANVGIGLADGTIPTAMITLADHTTAAGGIKFRSAASTVSLYSNGSGNLMCAADFNGSGRIRVPGGNAAADPDIGFTGAASGTGFSRAGNDITFITASTERMRIDSVGKVGIGTTSPSNILELYKTVSSAIGPILQLTNSQYNDSDDSGSSIQFRGYTAWGPGSTNPRYSEINAINGGGSVPKRIEFKFYADANIKTPLSILQTGNIGIGTTSPVMGAASAIGLNIHATTSAELKFTSNFTGSDAADGTSLYTLGDSFYITNREAGNLNIGTSNITRLSIKIGGGIQFNAYDSTNNTGTPTYLLGTDASGNVVKTQPTNSGQQIYILPSTSGASAWNLIGRFTAASGGKSVFIKMVTNAGYNANIDQNTEAYIRFKTSNGSSVDGNGFSGDSSFYTIGSNTGFPSGNFKWVSNAAGTAASSYELYMNMPSHTGSGGFYTVDIISGTWTPLNNAATDPGAASSTIMIPIKQFKVGGNDLVVGAGGNNSYFGNGNLGIGNTNPGSYKLNVTGSFKLGTNAYIEYGGVYPYTINMLNTASVGNLILNAGSGSSGYESRIDLQGSNTSTASGITLTTNSIARLTILVGGDVGIGDTTPSYKLDVNGTIRATGDVIAYSDARVKDNVKTIENALDKVTQLRGVSYTRNDVEDKTTKIGVIAQEVLEVLPEVVQQDDEGKYSVAYGNMVGLLIESIKELKAEVDELKSRL